MTDLAGHSRTFFFGGAGVAADLNGPYVNSGAAALLTLDEINSAGVVTEAAGAIVEGPGVISLELAAVGQFIFNGVNAFSGGVSIAGSTLVSVGASGALGTGAITFVTSGATPALESLAASFSTAQALVIDAGVSATLEAAAGDALTLTGAIDDQGGAGSTLHIGSATDTGTVVMAASAATENAAGALSIDGGTLRLGSAASATMVSALTGNVGVSGTLDLDGENVTLNDLTGSGKIVNSSATPATLTVIDSGNTFSGSISGAVALVVSEKFAAFLIPFILTGANTYTGGTVIGAGAELDIGDASSLATITGNVSDDGVLKFRERGLFVFAGAITGSGSLSQTGGNIKLTGDTSQFHGSANLGGGTTTLAAANAFSNISGLALGASETFRTTTSVTLTSFLSIGENPGDTATLAATANATLTFQGSFGAFWPVQVHIGSATDTGVVVLAFNAGEGFHGGGGIEIDGGTLDEVNGQWLNNDGMVAGLNVPVVFKGTSGKLILDHSGAIASSGAGSTGEVDLISGQVNFSGGGETVRFAPGTYDTATLANTGALWDAVYGAGGSVTLTGALASIVGGGNVVNFTSSTSNAASLYDTANNWDTVHGAGVVYLTNAQASVLNGGVTVYLLGAAPDAVSLYYTGAGWDTVYGSNGTVCLTGAQASLVGGGDKVYLLGAYASSVSLYNTNNSWDTIYGSNDLVILTNAQASVVGGGDTINFDGSPGNFVSLYGTGVVRDIVNAVNGSVTLNGAQAAIVGYSDTIYMTDASVANETLTNSAFHDTYVYRQAMGVSAITGFTAHDAMQLSKADFASVQDLFNHMTQSGADTIINLDANDQITLFNVQKSSLAQSQFSLT